MSGDWVYWIVRIIAWSISGYWLIKIGWRIIKAPKGERWDFFTRSSEKGAPWLVVLLCLALSYWAAFELGNGCYTEFESRGISRTYCE